MQGTYDVSAPAVILWGVLMLAAVATWVIAAEAAPIRLGRISYVNMAPVFYGLEAEVEEVTGVPTALNRLLLEGELDVAAIPSIEYARNADRLRLVPRLCVSAEGAVDSIQLFSRVPFEEVRTVAVTPHSATSVVLRSAAAGGRASCRSARRPTRSC